jgi:choline transport protein
MAYVEQGMIIFSLTYGRLNKADFEDQLSPRTFVPIYSVTATTVIACLLALVNIGSSTAFNGIVSISIAGLFSSYLLVSALLLYRRCSGAIAPADQAASPDAQLVWGPWRIPGVLGMANNLFACIYLTFVFIFSFWPSFSEVTPQTMNYSILVTGFVAIFSTLYYIFWARKTYDGPIVEVEPEFVGHPST